MTETAAPAASFRERVRQWTRPSSPARDIGVDLLLSFVCAVAVTLPILRYGTPDEETYEFSLFSTLYFVKALLSGGQPFFTPDFAFGVKIPNGQWFLRFPASLTAVFGSARILYSSMWLLGQLVFAFFFLRLLRYATTSAAVRVAAVVTAVLSFSNLGYFYIDDWPEVFLGWCLVPFCLWSTVALLEACRTGHARIGRMAICALAFGMLVGNGHPLHSFIWFTVFVPFFLPVLWATPSLFAVLAAVGGVAMLGALDIVVQTLAGLGSSHGTFNPLNDATQYPSLRAAGYFGFLQPVMAVTEGGWAGLLNSTYGRRPFYGAVFFVLAFSGSVLALIRPRVFPSMPNRGLTRAFGLAFLGTVLLTIAPSWAVFNLVGEGWHYKDGQTVFAIVLAAMMLQALLQRGWRKVTAGLLVVQVIQMILVAGPIVRTALMDETHLLFGRDVRGDAFWEQPAMASLRGGARVIAAGSLDAELFSNLRAEDGVVAVTDFVLEDIAIVNGWYRGTVTPRFAPGNDPRYGAYQTVLRWSQNLRYLDRSALNALGITHVLAFAGESEELRGSLELEEAGTVQVSGPKSPIAVLRNPGAWDRAVLIAGDGPHDLVQRSDCAAPFIWCADFSRLAASRVAGTRVRRQDDTFIVELPPGHPGGFVLLTQVLADGWVARVDGEARQVRPFHDVFVALDVSESDRIIELRYDSSSQALMLAISIGQMILCLAVYATFTLRRHGVTHAR